MTLDEKIARLLLRIWHWRIGHKWQFVRNIYGDEIIARNWMRSAYKCECGAYKYCPSLAGDEHDVRR